MRDFLHEFNWYTLRFGWHIIVRDPRPWDGTIRLVWEFGPTCECREEYRKL